MQSIFKLTNSKFIVIGLVSLLLGTACSQPSSSTSKAVKYAPAKSVDEFDASIGGSADATAAKCGPLKLKDGDEEDEDEDEEEDDDDDVADDDGDEEDDDDDQANAQAPAPAQAQVPAQAPAQGNAGAIASPGGRPDTSKPGSKPIPNKCSGQ